MPTAPLTNMVAGANDVEQVALVKLVYWLQSAAETLGVTGTTSMLLPSMAANWNDGKQQLIVKAAYWAEQIAGAVGGGGGGAAMTFGAYGAGDAIPTDGSITTQAAWNTTNGHVFWNTAWPNTAAPVWEAH